MKQDVVLITGNFNVLHPGHIRLLKFAKNLAKKLIVGVQKLSSIHNRALSKWRSYNVDWSSNDKKQDFFNKSVQEFTKCDHEKEQNKIFVKLTKLSVK